MGPSLNQPFPCCLPHGALLQIFVPILSTHLRNLEEQARREGRPLDNITLSWARLHEVFRTAAAGGAAPAAGPADVAWGPASARRELIHGIV